MAEIVCSVVVAGDPTTVYDFVSDADRHALWQRDLLVREKDEPVRHLASGTRWTEVRRLGPRNRRIDVSVTEASRPERIVFVGESGAFRGRSVVEFIPEGTRTRIVHRTEFVGRGISSALVPFVARYVQRALQANLYRLTMRLAQPVAQS